MRQAIRALCVVSVLGGAAVAFNAVTAQPAAAQESVAGPVLKEAYDLHQARRYPEASAKFEQGLRMNPSRSQAAVGFYLLGDSYQQMGEVNKARPEFRGLAAGRSERPGGRPRRASGLASSPPARRPRASPPRPSPPWPRLRWRSARCRAAPQAPPQQQSMAPPQGPLQPGTVIKDCEVCPPVVVVPPGQFMMGSSRGDGDERPVHPVVIPRPIAVGRFEVTFQEYDACVAAGGCRSNLSDRGWGRGSQPAIHATWTDAVDYARWLSAITGQRYRLPSESEWEYAARGGSQAEDVFGAGQANCEGCGSPWDGKRPAPVGRFAPNGYGLYDMLGNVWEWTLDCRNDDYRGAPNDGSAWQAGDCSRRSLRGGGYKDSANESRAAYRNKDPITDRDPDNGFRVVRELAF
jgi:formylglycine-generating enzyme required for sulfatase activity